MEAPHTHSPWVRQFKGQVRGQVKGMGQGFFKVMDKIEGTSKLRAALGVQLATQQSLRHSYGAMRERYRMEDYSRHELSELMLHDGAWLTLRADKAEHELMEAVGKALRKAIPRETAHVAMSATEQQQQAERLWAEFEEVLEEQKVHEVVTQLRSDGFSSGHDTRPVQAGVLPLSGDAAVAAAAATDYIARHGVSHIDTLVERQDAGLWEGPGAENDDEAETPFAGHGSNEDVLSVATADTCVSSRRSKSSKLSRGFKGLRKGVKNMLSGDAHEKGGAVVPMLTPSVKPPPLPSLRGTGASQRPTGASMDSTVSSLGTGFSRQSPPSSSHNTPQAAKRQRAQQPSVDSTVVGVEEGEEEEDHMLSGGLLGVDEHLSDDSITGYMKLRLRFRPVTSYAPDVALLDKDPEQEDPEETPEQKRGLMDAVAGLKRNTASGRRTTARVSAVHGVRVRPPPAPAYGVLIVLVKRIVAAHEKVKRPALALLYEGQLRRSRRPVSTSGGGSQWDQAYSFTTHAPAGLAELCRKSVVIRLYSMSQSEFMDPNLARFITSSHPGHLQGEASIPLQEAVLNGQVTSNYRLWLSHDDRATIAGNVYVQMNWYPVD